MFVPYSPASKGFAVHRPKLNDMTPSDADAQALSDHFFVGVDSHEVAGAVWNRHLDQSK